MHGGGREVSPCTGEGGREFMDEEEREGIVHG